MEIVQATTVENKEAFVEADQSYSKLREAIIVAVRKEVENKSVLLTQGPTIKDREGVKTDSRVLAHELWLATIGSQEARQYHNCRACHHNWEQLFNLVALREDNTLVFPAVEAFLGLSESDPLIARIFENAPSPEGFRKHLEDAANASGRMYFPLFKLSGGLIDQPDLDGWDHFAIGSYDFVKEYNDERTPFNDIIYIDKLLSKIADRRFDLATLTLLFTKIKHDIKVSGGYSYEMALINTNQFIDVVKRIKELGKRELQTPYLWSLLSENKNSYLRHIEGSVMGIMLDGYYQLKDATTSEGAENVVNETVRLIKNATDIKNYKVKTAPAAAATVESAVKFLKEHGCEHALERRTVALSEVKTIEWSVTTKPKDTRGELEKAVESVMANKKNDNVNIVNSALSITFSKKITPMEFVNMFDNLAEINLRCSGTGFMSFLTTSSVDGDYSKIFKFGDSAIDNGSFLMTSRPSALASHNQYQPFVIESIFSSLANNGEKLYILQNKNIAQMLATEVSTKHGSCVLGSLVNSEFYGYSGALVELSQKHELKKFENDVELAGGVVLTNSLLFDVVTKDGQSGVIAIVDK